MFEQAEPRCLTRRLSVSRCTGLVSRLEFKNKRHYHHLLLPEESSHHFNQPFSISLSIHPFTQLPITPPITTNKLQNAFHHRHHPLHGRVSRRLQPHHRSQRRRPRGKTGTLPLRCRPLLLAVRVLRNWR